MEPKIRKNNIRDDFEMDERQQKYYDILCEIAKERGFKVLGKYVNSRSKIEMVCSQGHNIYVKIDSFKQNRGCSRCSRKCPIQAKEELIKLAQQRNYKIVGEYIGAQRKIKMICPKGHEIRVQAHGFKQNKGCNKCIKHCPIQAKEEFHKLAEEKGFKIMGSYIRSKTKILMICPQGHNISIKPTVFKQNKQYKCHLCKRNRLIQGKKE